MSDAQLEKVIDASCQAIAGRSRFDHAHIGSAIGLGDARVLCDAEVANVNFVDDGVFALEQHRPWSPAFGQVGF